ncbi:hypothetical protein DPMN_119493 [Dreissena polymorpha]|uniref:Uncharacterized protein n=1 Tax=Dreissena polymorpha TaxID=45954 RepID=A0A9D4GQ19_DREPO|nr:hypothetical protein DPMN_119493 [Dreissena polymorpha]
MSVKDLPMYDSYNHDQPFDDQPTSRCIIVLTMSDDDQPEQPVYYSVNPVKNTPPYTLSVEDQRPAIDQPVSPDQPVYKSANDDQPV